MAMTKKMMEHFEHLLSNSKKLEKNSKSSLKIVDSEIVISFNTLKNNEKWRRFGTEYNKKHNLPQNYNTHDIGGYWIKMWEGKTKKNNNDDKHGWDTDSIIYETFIEDSENEYNRILADFSKHLNVRKGIRL